MMKTTGKLVWTFTFITSLTPLNDVWGAGFEVKTRSDSLGHSHAGSAAECGKIDYMTHNPAVLAHIAKHQVTASATGVFPTIKYQDSGSGVAGINNVLNNGKSTKGALIPAAYLGLSYFDKVKFGIAITVPFGLETSYKKDFVGRYWNLHSQMKTINIAPVVAYKINEQWGVGAGLQIQRMDVKLTRALNTPAILAGAINGAPLTPLQKAGLNALAGLNNINATGTNANDIQAKFQGDNWSYGALFGVTFKPRPGTQIGASYRSQVKHNLRGKRSFAVSPNTQNSLNGFAAGGGGALIAAIRPNITNSDIKSTIKTPDAIQLGLSHHLTSEWRLLAEVIWTHWSLVKEIRVKPQGLTGVKDDIVPFKWKDTYSGALGLNYRPKSLKRWLFKMGAAYDPTPIKDNYRYPAVPDSDRVWVSGGVQYETLNNFILALNYAHEFVKNAKSNLRPEAGTSDYTKGNLIGTYKGSVDIVSANISYRF